MFIMINLLWICWWIIISSINIITLLCLGFLMIVILPVLMMMTNETWLRRCRYGLGCKYLLIWSDLISVYLHQSLCDINHQCFRNTLHWYHHAFTDSWNQIKVTESCDFSTCITYVYIYFWDNNIYFACDVFTAWVLFICLWSVFRYWCFIENYVFALIEQLVFIFLMLFFVSGCYNVFIMTRQTREAVIWWW